MQKLTKKLIWWGVFTILFGCFWWGGASTASTGFYYNLEQLSIPVQHILHQEKLSRYSLTRLLNAVECHDCIVPRSETRLKYDEPFWSTFTLLPGKDFRDISYLSGNHQGINYYYCVAKVGDDDSMRGYPLATSPICGGRFCGERNVNKAEFFQTLVNLLTEKIKTNYSAPRKEIKSWIKKQEKTRYEYRVFTTAELELLWKKENQSSKIESRLEFTTYLKYCMFNPSECGFQTFDLLWKGMRPLSEVNVLIQAGVITDQDLQGLSTAISPKDALEKLALLHELHTKCDFDSDYDCDGIPNHEDNCPYTYNPSQNDLDGHGIGDVCDDDIDGDGLKNPVGLVDDSWTLNVAILKYQKSDDPTPLGEHSEKNQSFFIKVLAMSQGHPTLVQLELVSEEPPLSVERDFGDLIRGKGVKTQHLYSTSGVSTIMAKVVSKSGQTFLLSQQIFLGETSDTAYSLNISNIELNPQAKTGSFQAEFQGKIEYFEWENTATQTKQSLTSATTPFLTNLEQGKRNNITLKGYAQGKLVAVASTDILDQDWNFFSISPSFSPLIKTVGANIGTTMRLNNLSLSSIETIKRDFGDGTNFTDTKLVNYHRYASSGKRILIQKVRLKNGQELISSSSLTLQNPEIVGNQAMNIQATPLPEGNLALHLQPLGREKNQLRSLKTFLNGQENFSHQGGSDSDPFFSIQQRQGLVKIKNEILIGTSIRLQNEGVALLGMKNPQWATLNLDTTQLFSGLKCDLDQDGIPDLYDDDIDGDGVKNLLGMVLYERADCQLIVGDSIDSKRYEQHFWVCSLDNCPLQANSDQNDLNVNGMGDTCEQDTCGNGKIDPWEDCRTCPKDVEPCTARCGNGKVEPAEDCKNCPKDVPVCPPCGNGKVEPWEFCDHGTQNGKDGKCSFECKLIDPKKPLCGNGKIDPWEDCRTCPEDLKKICVDKGEELECGNGKVDPWETCTNCPQDVPNCPPCGNGKIDPWEDCRTCPKDVEPCTARCGNGKVEPAEDCKNCPKDVPVCKETLCGNGKVEPWEFCDHGTQNGKDGKCSFECKLIDPKKPLCGNGKVDPWEDCKTCPEDLKKICVDKGEELECGNGKVDPWETCTNCPQDVPNCPPCGNGKIDPWEDCRTCPEDLKERCIDIEILPFPFCGNGKVDPWETCTNCPKDVPNCDQDEDGCPDPEDPCPSIPGINSCCPDIPPPCKGADCYLITAICNQCPCHFADYSNTLQKDDQVRARLWDKSFKAHYNYSPFVPIKPFLGLDKEQE